MFAPDVLKLREFYATPLGMATADRLQKAILRLWPDAMGDAWLGIGYVLPYAAFYLSSARPLLVAMPAQMGALKWPPSQAGCVFLTHEGELPLPDISINRVLLVHCVENSEQLSSMMEEIWRVLTPGGRVLVVVPNRRGLWARSPKSPFGYGRPFSLSQLREMLGEKQFTLTRVASALFMPPTYLSFMWRMAEVIEMLGRTLCGFWGGVWLVEAEKQLYAAVPQKRIYSKTGRIAVTANPALGKSRG